METSSVRSTGSELTGDEDAAASHVWELIGGMIGGVAAPTGEPGEKESWSLEEGDDSVFYSDEEQPHPDAAEAAGAKVCQRLTNSVAEDEPGEVFPRRSTSDFKGDATPLLICPKDIEKKLEAAKHEEPIVFGEESTESGVTAEELEGSCREMLPSNSPDTETAADEVNQVKEEEVAQKAQTTDQDSVQVFREQSHREAEASTQLTDAEPLVPTARQLRDHQGAERSHDLRAHAGPHPNLGSGYSTLPMMKKAEPSVGHQETFNHLSSSSKYSTVSYRKIRRGNTRQRIEEFEHFMQNQ